MTRAILATTLLAAAAPWAAADEVWLKGGGRIVGEVMERRPQSVVIDVGPGTVTLPMTRVDRIVGGSSRLAEYRSRAARLNPDDVPGWLALASWADQNDLRTQARGAWEHLLSVQPGNTVAQQALGNVFQAGRWMERSDAMRARGLVEWDGEWMTPGEREARLRVQATEAATLRENAIADARVAEAEAWAREAEARARAAEADATRADGAYDDGGIPLGFGAVGYGYGYGGYGPGIVVGPPMQPWGGRGHDRGFHPDRGRRHDPPPTPPQRDGGRRHRETPVH
jgi:hypothetical protein